MKSKKIADMRSGQGAVAITFGGPRFIPGTSVGSSKKRKPRTGVPTDGMAGTRQKPGPLGRVLHVLSHFGRQQNKEDEFAMQNLLLNFLIEAQRGMPNRKK